MTNQTEALITRTNTLNMYEEIMDKRLADFKWLQDIAKQFPNEDLSKPVAKLEKLFDEAYHTYYNYL